MEVSTNIFKNYLSTHIKTVNSGKVITITSRSKPVAALISLADCEILKKAKANGKLSGDKS